MKGVEEWDEDRVNGIDVDALSDVIRDVGKDPRKGLAEFRVKTVWQGRARSETTIESCSIGGKTVPRNFSIAADEPTELLGENSAANPQELLMAALNSCLMVSYVASAAIKGIELESIEIETEGELDLHADLVVGADGRASAAATSGRRVATCQRRASAEGQPSLCSERKGISSVGRKGSGRLRPFVFTDPPPT